MFAFTTAATEVDAVCTSLSVAREPEEREAPVRVRVAADQMSVAIAVPDVSVLVAAFQTLSGIDVARDVEAARTVASVFALTALVIPEVCAFVFAFTTAAIEVEAVVTVEFTLVVARLMSAFVAREPVVKPAPVRVRVAEIHTSEASVPKDESVRTLEFHTLVGIVRASEVEAVLIVALTAEVTAPV